MRAQWFMLGLAVLTVVAVPGYAFEDAADNRCNFAIDPIGFVLCCVAHMCGPLPVPLMELQELHP